MVILVYRTKALISETKTQCVFFEVGKALQNNIHTKPTFQTLIFSYRVISNDFFLSVFSSCHYPASGYLNLYLPTFKSQCSCWQLELFPFKFPSQHLSGKSFSVSSIKRYI